MFDFYDLVYISGKAFISEFEIAQPAAPVAILKLNGNP